LVIAVISDADRGFLMTLPPRLLGDVRHFRQAIALFAVHTEGLFVESLQYGRAGRLKALSHEPLRRRRQPHELASLENRPAG